MIQCCLFSVETAGNTTSRGLMFHVEDIKPVVSCCLQGGWPRGKESNQLSQRSMCIYGVVLHGCLQCWRVQFLTTTATQCKNVEEQRTDSIYDNDTVSAWKIGRCLLPPSMWMLLIEMTWGLTSELRKKKLFWTLIAFEFELLYWRCIHWCKFLEGLKT